MQGRLSGFWLAFTLDTPEAQAVRRFQEKQGHAPAQVVRSKGLLLVGPVDGADKNHPNGRESKASGGGRGVVPNARPLTRSGCGNSPYNA